VRLSRWWSKKYRLPANHDLFIARSYAEWHLEYLEDLYFDRQAVIEELEYATGDEVRALQGQLRSLSEALGIEASYNDPLVEKWEQEIAEGKVPSFEE